MTRSLVTAAAARDIARDWVLAHAGDIHGFVGAYTVGSVNELPEGASLSPTSDVDVMVVVDVIAAPPKAGKFRFRGVLLAGHSLGALKVGHYQALRQDSRVLGIVAASPPVAASRVDPALLAIAERLVADGQGDELLPWGSSPAGAGRLSAGCFDGGRLESGRREAQADAGQSQPRQ